MSLSTRQLRVLRHVGLGAAIVAAVLIASQLFPASWPLGFITAGGVSGCGVGLLAVGLVLTYRTSRIINFAHGAIGSFAAEVGIFAFQKDGLPWAAAVVLSILVGVAAGVVIELVLRRLRNAPRLVVTVATIGLLQVMVGLQFAIPYLFHGPLIVTGLVTPLSKIHFVVAHSVFYGNDLLAVVVTVPILIGLSWFLLRTDYGTAVRAIAENSDRAQLLGIPVHRLNRLVWAITGGTAAIVMTLNAPTNGLPVSPFVATGGVFVPALAAAMVARMESLPLAFFAGLAISVVQAVAFQNFHQEALGTVLFLAVVLVALLARRWDTSRAEAASESLSLVVPSRRLPAEVAGLREIQVGRAAVVVAVAAVAIALPGLVTLSNLHLYSGYLLLGVAVLSLVVLSGWAGVVSLGQFAIVGVGAIVTGDLIVHLNLDLFMATAVGAVAGGLAALVLGAPALRVKGLYVAVTSVVFADAMDQYFLNPSNFPSAIPGSITRPVLLDRVPLSSERAMYYLCLALLVVCILLVRALRAGRIGRVLIAGRDNPRAASAMAIPVARVRIAGMVIAGLFAGAAGGLYAVLQNGVGYGSFDTQTSVVLFSMAVVGGLASTSGALCGVAVTEALITLIGHVSSQAQSLAPLATGGLLLGVLLALPGGVGQAIEWARDRIATRVAARHGITMSVGVAAGSDVVTPDTAVPAQRRTPDAAMLSCRSLTASYGPLQVLFGVDLDIRAGEIVALLGTNGAGKSTVLRALTGLLGMTGGEASFDGASLTGREAWQIATTGISMMPGGRGVFPTLSVEANLRLAAWQLRHDRVRADAAYDEMLELFPILRDRRHQLAGNLSGGEQQQLSLAMAFVTKPTLLLIDELSLGLAPTVVSQLCDKVREIHASGTTIVVVEQSVNVALALAERAVFLEKGTVRFEGPTRDLLDRDDLLRSVFIGEHASASDTDLGDRNDRGVGLSVHGLVKTYGGISALDGVSLTIPPGRIVGLIGHNGAGKTTLMDAVSGFTTPDAGAVMFGGQDITGLRPDARAALGIGRSFQEAMLYPSLSVEETIRTALERHLANRDPFAAALRLPAATESEAAAASRVAEVIELLGLGGFATTPVADLSTGTRRIVELACVVAQDPAVILLDEPSAGVAQRETEALGPLLRRIQSDTGAAICLIEHDMSLMAGLCDELVALELGAVIATGSPDEVLSHPRVIASYLGTDIDAVERSGRRDRRSTGRGREPRAAAARRGQPAQSRPRATRGAATASAAAPRSSRRRPPSEG